MQGSELFDRYNDSSKRTTPIPNGNGGPEMGRNTQGNMDNKKIYQTEIIPNRAEIQKDSPGKLPKLTPSFITEPIRRNSPEYYKIAAGIRVWA